MGGPLISVVMPNYNTDERYLRASIGSILAQTCADFEFIIVDDASTDGSVAVIREYTDERIRLLQNERNRGVSYTLNRGLEVATGRYIARMDADDIAAPDRFERQAAWLEAHRDVAVLAARAQNFGDRKGLFACLCDTPEAVRQSLFFGCMLNHPSTMLRRAFIEQNGLRYDESFTGGEDYLFWSECAQRGSIMEYPRVLLYYRRHVRQVSITDRRRQIDTSNRVRLYWLEKLGLRPSGAELWMHYALCIGAWRHRDIPAETGFTMEALADWCARLCDANRDAGIFRQGPFEETVAAHFWLVAAKGRVLRQAAGTAFARRIGRLRGLRLLGRHMVFSIRLNQRLVPAKKPPEGRGAR